jgi:hypothetical protein
VRIIRRGQLGNRRTRSRRAEEAEALAALDPARAAELEELRRYNPQAYRKELRRLVRDGVIPSGRGWDISRAALEVLQLDEDAVRASVERSLASGDFTWRTLAGLAEAESSAQGREALVGWLVDRWEALVGADDSAREAHLKARAAAVRMRKAPQR